MRNSFLHFYFFYSVFTVSLLLISLQSIAQPRSGKADKYWTAGFNFGLIGFSPSSLNVLSGTNYFQRTTNGFGLGQVEDVSGRKHLALLTNTSIGLNAGILFGSKNGNSFTGIQMEFQNNKACYSFDPPFKFVTHGDSMNKWVQSDKYLKYSLAVQYCHYLNDNSRFFSSRYLYLRESFGQTFFHRNFDNVIREGQTEDWTEKGTGMISKIVSVNKTSFMLGTEIGFKSFSDDNQNTIDFGLVYYAPFSNTYTEEDEFFKQGASVGKSQITFNGGTIMFNLRYTYNIKIKEPFVDPEKLKEREEILARKEEEAEQKKYEREEKKQKEHQLKKEKTEDKQMVKNHKVNGRDSEVQFKMKVKSDSLIVEVWDRGRVDGDRISLYLNDKLVLEDCTLAKEKKQIVLHLLPGINYLTMYALNLGSIPPNTAAMDIYTGTGKQSFKVVSDTGKSGAIEIVYKPF